MKYYLLGSQRVAMRQTWSDGTQKVFYLHGDHLGSTSLPTDSNGAMVSECRYYPYGQERGCTGEDKTDFGFTGQRNEAGFGLMDYNARYYSPRLGRFVSPDSVIPGVTSQDWNRYSYVKNNPVKYTDPSGHFPWLVAAAVALFAIDKGLTAYDLYHAQSQAEVNQIIAYEALEPDELISFQLPLDDIARYMGAAAVTTAPQVTRWIGKNRHGVKFSTSLDLAKQTDFDLLTQVQTEFTKKFGDLKTGEVCFNCGNHAEFFKNKINGVDLEFERKDIYFRGQTEVYVKNADGQNVPIATGTFFSGHAVAVDEMGRIWDPATNSWGVSREKYLQMFPIELHRDILAALN